MMRSTSSPASVPASFVACRCESSKYAGTVMIACVTSSPSEVSQNSLISRRMNEEISCGECILSPIWTYASPLGASTIPYGTMVRARCTSGVLNLRPIKRFTA